MNCKEKTAFNVYHPQKHFFVRRKSLIGDKSGTAEGHLVHISNSDCWKKRKICTKGLKGRSSKGQREKENIVKNKMTED